MRDTPIKSGTPFDITLDALVAEWGVPYIAWTREQHWEHTRRMYHLLGWGDDAIERSVIVDNHRGKSQAARERTVTRAAGGVFARKTPRAAS